jgi:hypothetical protein
MEACDGLGNGIGRRDGRGFVRLLVLRAVPSGTVLRADTMSDFIFVGLAVVFFIGLVLYIAALEKI